MKSGPKTSNEIPANYHIVPERVHTLRNGLPVYITVLTLRRKKEKSNVTI